MDIAASEPVTIDPAPSKNPGLDYAALKQEGTELCQRLSGAIWTDYNEHDPGVTTLEQLCYALTELSYRAELPLRDLLTRPTSGRIDARRQALFPARAILPVSPVTEGDYRKLLVDRVPGVRNAWLTPLPATRPGDIDGLYQARVYVPGVDPCCPDPDGAIGRVERRTARVYAAHRNLCEDLGAPVIVLQPLPVAVYGELSLRARSDPERVLARALFDLGRLLAPELHRRSLKSLLDAGRTPDEIFIGPLLRHGFIDDEQLQPKADCIGVDEIAGTLARTPGVRSARGVRVVARGGDVRGGLRLGPDEVARLDARAPGGGFTLRLLRNGVAYTPDAARVERELARLWTGWRRPWPLAPEYRELLPFPQGQARHVRRYTSIQDQYPRVYGIGPAGLPQDATDARRGQARQLKGYLLAFEQLLADFFAQLGRARDLFSVDPRLRRTYFFQSLERSVPDVAPLLRPDYRAGLRRLVRSQDDFLLRRNRFLDVLLALFAETLSEDDVSEFSAGGGQDDDARARLLRAKLRLLARLPRVTRDRGRGFDVSAPPSPRNVAGLVPKTRIQLGFTAEGAPLSDFVDDQGLRLVGRAPRAAAGRALARHGERVERHFGPLGEIAPGAAASSPLRGAAVSEALLRAARRASNLRVGRLPGEKDAALLCRSGGAWRQVGRYPDEVAAAAAGGALMTQAREFSRRSGQLYVVEHVLLRWGRRDGAQADACPPPETPFVYDFTASVVISAPRELRCDPGWRRFARQVTRANAPSHVALAFVFLGARRLCRFERLYWAWRRALRAGGPRDRARASARLRDFLARHDAGGRRDEE